MSCTVCDGLDSIALEYFRIAALDLIVLRRKRLDALSLADLDRKVEVEDMEAKYVALVDTAA